MKKYLVLSFLLACCFVSSAYDFSVVTSGQTLYYTITSSASPRTVAVTYPGSSTSNPWAGYTKPTESLTIPFSVSYGGNTYSVTSIGSYAFDGCSDLTSVTIPNSVTAIENNAFYFCSGLTSVTIPNSVTSIGGFAFYFCSGITSITIPNSVDTIGSYAFSGIKVVNYCGSASGNPWGAYHAGCGFCEEGDFIYQDNTKTTLIAYVGSNSSVTIPNSVTTIGISAFRSCSDLTSVTIPNSVTSIGDYAFYSCSGITSMTIPNSVTSIGSFVLYACRGLTSVVLPNLLTTIRSYVFYSCSGLTNVTLPNSVTSIENNAFENCSGLTSLTIPDSVTSIGNNAFSGCSGLTSVTIPSAVTTIGSSAFRGCSGLTSVTVPDSVATIGNFAFSGVKVVNYCGPASGNPWDAYHAGCGFCEEGDFIYQDNTKTTLLAYVGSNSSVTIPNSVTTIGIFAFGGCGGLTSVIIPNSVTTIESSAFRGCSGLTSVAIPDSVTTIGDYAFYSCSNLTGATLGSSLTSIGNNAFSDCSGLTSVTIPDLVTSIGGSAFSGCSGLTSVTLGSSVTSIGYNAFSGCKGLTSVTIPNTVASIGGLAFSGIKVVNYCGSASGNPWGAYHVGCGFCKEGDFIYEDGTKTTLIAYVGSDSSVSIPNSVIIIGNNAFSDCGGLTSVTIHNEVTSIESYAFANCSGITSMTIPSSVTSIETSAFSGCSSLASVIIPNSVTRIGNYVFNDCIGLTNVTIPNSVTSIGNFAFGGCSGLTSVTIPNSVTSIGNAAFESCSGLASVTIPNSVTTIGFNAFRSCVGLASVTIGSSVNSIRERAFYSCSGLTEVWCSGIDAPNIESSVFALTNLQSIHIPCEGYESYMNRWSDYSSMLITPDPLYERRLLAADSAKGSVKILTLPCRDTSTIIAIPNYGYHFTQWNDGVTANPRTFVLTQDTTFIAEFGTNSYSITGAAGNASLGQVQGGGTFLYLDTAELTATAVAHYHFTHWQDSNTANPRSIVVYSDSVFTAQFAIDTHHIVVVSSDTNKGYVTGGGYIAYGQSVAVEATAHSGYHFSCWSNGCRYNPYTFAVVQDSTLSAVFVSDETPTHTITVAANNAAMGLVDGGGTYDDGTVALLTALPSEGCRFLHWSDGSTEAQHLVSINASVTYTAYFAPESCLVTTETNDAVAGVVSGDGIYAMGDTLLLTATANEGYRFVHWDDGSVDAVRIIAVDENLITAMQPLGGAAYGITFTAYFENSTQGIETVQKNYTLTVMRNAIRINGAMGETVRVFDVVGRQLLSTKNNGEDIQLNQTGVLFVQVGNALAQKIVVIP